MGTEWINGDSIVILVEGVALVHDIELLFKIQAPKGELSRVSGRE